MALLAVLLACSLVSIYGHPHDDPAKYRHLAPCEAWKCNFKKGHCSENADKKTISCNCVEGYTGADCSVKAATTTTTTAPATTTPTTTTPTTTTPTTTTPTKTTTTSHTTTPTGCAFDSDCHDNPSYGFQYACSDGTCVSCGTCSSPQYCVNDNPDYGSGCVQAPCGNDDTCHFDQNSGRNFWCNSNYYCTPCSSFCGTGTSCVGGTCQAIPNPPPSLTWCEYDGECHNDPSFGTNFFCDYWGTGTCLQCRPACAAPKFCFFGGACSHTGFEGSCANDNDCHDREGLLNYWCDKTSGGGSDDNYFTDDNTAYHHSASCEPCSPACSETQYCGANAAGTAGICYNRIA